MILGRPLTAGYAYLDDTPGLATLQVGIETPTGTVVSALTPAGITEVHPGEYTALLTWPAAAGNYVVVWTDGGEYVSREELIVSSAVLEALAPTGPTTGISFGELVADLQAMTSLTPARAKSRLNQAYRRFVEKSEAIKAKVTIGTTVSGQSDYDLEYAIIGLRGPIRVNGLRYDQKSSDELDDLNANDGWLAGWGPVRFFAPEYDDLGGGQVKIYPTPDDSSAGLPITARCSLYPADMVGDDEYPRIPASYHDALADGAFAIGLGRDDERFPERQQLMQEFDARALECAGQQRRRVGSGGIARISVRR